MQFEWDAQKNSSNRQKHGISFEEASCIFDNPVLTKIDVRRDYGEIRAVSYGMIAEFVVVAVVHTDRNGKKRIISARRAEKTERKNYYEHIKKTTG